METCVSVIRLLTAKDIQSIFGIGKNQAYALMNSDGFPTIKLNNRLYVTQKDLEKWLDTYKGRSYLFETR